MLGLRLSHKATFVLVEAPLRVDSGVFLGVVVEFHLVVCMGEIHFGEELSSLQALDHVLQRWNRVLFKIQHLIGSELIISANADVSIRLVSYDYGAGIL